MINLQIDYKIEYIVDMLMVICYYLNLYFIEVLEKIYLRNVHYVRKKIITLSLL
jgi:hypothetical protein